jgi:hypothetical protein
VLEGLESSAYRVGVSLNKGGAMAGLILARVLVLILLVGLGTGCGGGSSSNESRSTTSQTKINTRDKAAAQRNRPSLVGLSDRLARAALEK